MRIALLLLGSAAAMLGAAPVSAQPTEAESRLIAAFTAICLEHMGDAAVQASTAAAAPWNFTTGDPATAAGLTRYQSGSTRLGIGASTATCTMTGVLEPQVTLTSFRAALADAIGTDEGQPLTEADSRYWLIEGNGGEENVLALKVSNETGRNLATLWVQRRATVSNGNQ